MKDETIEKVDRILEIVAKIGFVALIAMLLYWGMKIFNASQKPAGFVGESHFLEGLRFETLTGQWVVKFTNGIHVFIISSNAFKAPENIHPTWWYFTNEN